MAHKRMLNKNIVVDAQVCRLSEFAQLFYTWMIPFLDDFGRITADPFELNVLIVPLLHKSAGEIESALIEICSSEIDSKMPLAAAYEVDGSKILQFKKKAFEDHQSGIIGKRTRSKYADPLPDTRLLYRRDGDVKFFDVLGSNFAVEKTETNIKPVKVIIRKSRAMVDVERFIKIIPDKLAKIDGFTEAYTKWIQHRDQMRKPLTLNSVELQMKFLLKQPDPVLCVLTAVEKSWQGIYEVKNNGTKNTKTNTTKRSSEFSSQRTSKIS